jgi:6-phosphogluconolactonase (cycloisomerase 2 family)
MRSFLCVVVGSFLAGVPAGAQMLLVANQKDQSLSLIDPVAAKQITAIKVGGVTGHEVVATLDGKTAFVPIYGDSGVGKPGTNGEFISVIDLQSRKVVGKIDFGHGVRPHCAIYDPNSGMLYVTTELDKSVSVIDPKTMTIVGSVPTGQEQSHMLVLSKDGRRGYTANVGPGTVSVLDMVGRKMIAVIPISGNTQRISMSRDGSMVFTADQTQPRLAVIDTSSNKVRSWIALPAVGYGTASTVDGRWLLVCLRPSGKVAVVDLRSMQVAKVLDVPAGPSEVVVSPDGKMAYVACGGKDQVAAIDLEQWRVSKLIDAGKDADGMAWVQ